MLIIAISWSVDMRDVIRGLGSIRPVPFAVLCITGLLDRVLMAYKWSLLLRARGILITLWQSIRLYFVGYLLGTFTPGAIAGDVFRVTALANHRETKVVVASVLIERVIGFAVIGIAALITLPYSLKYFGTSTKPIAWTIFMSTVLLLAIVFISFNSKVVRFVKTNFHQFGVLSKLSDFYLTFADYRASIGTLIVFTALTILEFFLVIVINFYAARSLGLEIHLIYFVCVIPIIQLLIRLPISFYSLGIQEGLYVYFIVAAGQTTSDGFSISILLRLADIFLIFLPAILMLLFYPIQINRRSEPSKKL